VGEVTVCSEPDSAGCLLVGESELLMRSMEDRLHGNIERQGRDEGLHKSETLIKV